MTHPGESIDPARAYLSSVPQESVIVWTHEADVSRHGFTGPEHGLQAYVGYVQEVHDWGLVVGSPMRTWWLATRWDLIEWAGPRQAFP